MSFDFNFDPKDPSIKALFSEIGIPEKSYEDGLLTKEELFNAGINAESLSVINTGGSREKVEGHEVVHYSLSSRNAKQVLALIDKQGESVRNLFFSEVCPGSGISAPMILANLYSDFSSFDGFGEFRSNTIIYIEDSCHYSPDFSPLEQGGIYYAAATVPANVKDWGKYVVRIFNSDGWGSGVITGGRILTAAHVIFDDKGNFKNGMTIELEGKIIPIRSENVALGDTKNDMAIVEIAELKDTLGLPIASKPPQDDEPVWAIGFPGIVDSLFPIQPKGPIKKIYTRGTVLNSSTYRIWTTVKIVPGYSGGAIINDKGELIGILSIAKYDNVFARYYNRPKFSIAVVPNTNKK